MMRRIIPLVLFAMALGDAGQALAQQNINDQLVAYAQEGEFKKVRKLFAKPVQAKVKPARLKLIWSKLEETNGPLKQVGNTTTTKRGNMTVLSTPLQFEKSKLILKTSTNADKKIVGFFFDADVYAPPKWALNQSFGKEQIVVRTDSFELEGELMTPTSGFPCPLVVLVHGSGPGDRNSALPGTPNQPFQDLAYGLALNGVATIRYDKRSLVYPHSYQDSVTLANEVVEDAVSAIRLARSLEFVDSSKVFVLGHSLGGYTAPAIGFASKANGVIMLAAPSRPLHQILPEQYKYILYEDSIYTEEEQKLIKAVQDDVKYIDGDTSMDGLKQIGSAIMVPYYRTASDYDPIKFITKTSRPTFILQGERDYQVSFVKDYGPLQSALKHKPYVSFKSYPALDHLFMPGEGPSYPSDYSKPNHVALDVIQDIANWITNQ